MKERISTYADGSIAVSGMEIPAPPAASGTMSTMSVGGCSTSSTAYKSTYTNCLADVNLGVVRMYFRFNWQKTYGVSATITGFNPDSYGGHCIGCSLSDNRVYRISSTDVRYAATSSVAWDGSPIQMTAYMGARTSLANGAYTYHHQVNADVAQHHERRPRLIHAQQQVMTTVAILSIAPGTVIIAAVVLI